MFWKSVRRPFACLDVGLAACYLAFVFLSVVVTGYGSWINNHAVQMPLVGILGNPRLYPNDAFVQTLHNYPVTLWRVVAFLGHFMKTTYVLAGGFLLTRFLMVFSAWMLGSALVPGSRLAPLAAMAFISMAPLSIIGAGTIIPNYFEQSGLAMAVYLLAMSAFLRQQRWGCALLLVTGFYLNIMYGIFFVVYLGMFALYDRTISRDWRRWTLPAGFALLLILPLALYTARSMKAGPYDMEAWLQVMFIRVAHHMDPLAWDSRRWIGLEVFVGMCLFCAAWFRREHPVVFRFVVSASLSCILWTGLCFVARFSRSPFLLTLHSARGTDFFYCMGGIAVAALAGRLERGEERRTALVFLPILLALILQEWPRASGPILLASLICSVLLLSGLPRVGFRRMAALLLAAVAVWGVLQMSHRGWRIIAGHDLTASGIATWAQSETREDAVFLIDPTWAEFRSLAQRPVYVSWKDGGAVPWSRAFARVWLNRMGSLGVNLDGLHKGAHFFSSRYNRLNDQSVTRIDKRIRLNYWVMERTHPTRFKTVFECGTHKVVAIGKIASP